MASQRLTRRHARGIARQIVRSIRDLSDTELLQRFPAMRVGEPGTHVEQGVDARSGRPYVATIFVAFRQGPESVFLLTLVTDPPSVRWGTASTQLGRLMARGRWIIPVVRTAWLPLPRSGDGARDADPPSCS
jgi:hypothetical protein